MEYAIVTQIFDAGVANVVFSLHRSNGPVPAQTVAIFSCHDLVHFAAFFGVTEKPQVLGATKTKVDRFSTHLFSTTN